MGTAPGQSTPGTQSVPGQTPQVPQGAGEPGAPEEAGGPAHAPHLQHLLQRFPELSVPDWRYADAIPTAAVPADAPDRGADLAARRVAPRASSCWWTSPGCTGRSGTSPSR